MTFKDFIHDRNVLRALEELGYTAPTEIQRQAIPEIIQGRDLRASAQTGTGKTAAFILPALLRLSQPVKAAGRGARVLVLVPTRELAMQVAEEAAKYSRYMSRVNVVCVYGGASYFTQDKQLRRPYEILVATPGRLMDHMERGKIDFSRIELFILDEADRMLDMGFIQPVEKIASALPASRQTLMFSATLKGPILKLSERLLRNPKEVRIEPDPALKPLIQQYLQPVAHLQHKYLALEHLLKDEALAQAIVFTSTKRQADRLADELQEKGFLAAALHGNMNQRQRSKTIAQLREGTLRILIATDVAARGIDVPAVSHVINFDLPRNLEDYVHRIGRTGRAGASGIAFSFVTHQEAHQARQIERFTGQKMTLHAIPGLEVPMPAPKAPKAPQSKRFSSTKRPPSRRRFN